MTKRLPEKKNKNIQNMYKKCKRLLLLTGLAIALVISVLACGCGRIGRLLHSPFRFTSGSREDTIDVSGEVTGEQVPLFLQYDERWGKEQYGDDSMSKTGCGPTCLSMVYCYLTGDASMHPGKMAEDHRSVAEFPVIR